MARQDPAYRKFSRKDRSPLAFVELDGRRIYLGKHGSPESHQRYHRILAEWNANGRRQHAEQNDVTVLEVIDRFWQHAKEYYHRADGTPTGEVCAFKYALKPLKELYGDETAVKFGPRALKALRDVLVKEGGARKTINEKIRKIKQAFKWAVAEELIPPDVYQALHVVPGLKRGRTEAYETEPVPPENPIRCGWCYSGRQNPTRKRRRAGRRRGKTYVGGIRRLELGLRWRPVSPVCAWSVETIPMDTSTEQAGRARATRRGSSDGEARRRVARR